MNEFSLDCSQFGQIFFQKKEVRIFKVEGTTVWMRYFRKGLYEGLNYGPDPEIKYPRGDGLTEGFKYIYEQNGTRHEVPNSHKEVFYLGRIISVNEEDHVIISIEGNIICTANAEGEPLECIDLDRDEKIITFPYDDAFTFDLLVNIKSPSGNIPAEGESDGSINIANTDTDEPDKDQDQDGIPDNIDPDFIDTDKDGYIDSEDEFPDDPSEWQDTDKDGVGDNADYDPNDPNVQYKLATGPGPIYEGWTKLIDSPAAIEIPADGSAPTEDVNGDPLFLYYPSDSDSTNWIKFFETQFPVSKYQYSDYILLKHFYRRPYLSKTGYKSSKGYYAKVRLAIWGDIHIIIEDTKGKFHDINLNEELLGSWTDETLSSGEPFTYKHLTPTASGNTAGGSETFYWDVDPDRQVLIYRLYRYLPDNTTMFYERIHGLYGDFAIYIED